MPLGRDGRPGIISMSRSYLLDAWSSWTMLVINAVANYFLIRSMGIVGAAWATLLSLVLVGIFRTWFLHHRYGLWPFDRRTLLALLLLAAIGMVVPWIALTGHPIWDILLRSAIITALLWPAAHLLGLVPELMDMVWAVRSRMERKGS